MPPQPVIQPAISTDFKTILEEVANEAFKGRRPIRSVATGTQAADRWIAADEFMGTSPRQYDGVTLHVLTDDSAAPPGNVDQARLITDFLSSGSDFTLQSGFTGYTPAVDDVALFYYGAGADQMKHAVNETLKNFQLPKIQPATLVFDGNMEQAGVANYTLLGGAPAPEKDTTFALFGTQSLHVGNTNSGAQGVESAGIPVSENANVMVSVPIMMHSLTATAPGVTVILRNVEAAENIASITYTAPVQTDDAPLQLWHWFLFNTVIPTTCRTVKIQVLYAGGANTEFFIDHMGLLSSRDLQVSLPDGIRTTDVFGYKIFDLAQALTGVVNTGANGSVYAAQSLVPRSAPQQATLTQYGAVDPYRIIVPWHRARPLFFEYLDPNPKLTTLSSTTIAPLEPLVSGSVARVFEGMASRTKDPMALNRWTALMNRWDVKYHDLLKKDELDQVPDHLGQRRVSVR